MTDTERFNELFASAARSAEYGGKYSTQLSHADNQLLDQFVLWLRENGIKESTSRSYRTYMAKALAMPEAKLTSDQRSAVRKFQEFIATLA